MVPDELKAEFEQHQLSQEEMERLFQTQRRLSKKLEEEAKRQELRSRNTKIFLISFALAAVTTFAVLVVSQFIGLGRENPIEAIFNSSKATEKFAEKSDLERVRASTDLMRDAIKRAIERAEDKPELGPMVNIEASFIKAKLDSLDQRLNLLEKSISDSPEKALSIPMLRKDQDSLSKLVEANKIVVAAELARINDLQKWILGGIGAVLVTVIAGLFTAFFNVWSKSRTEL